MLEKRGVSMGVPGIDIVAVVGVLDAVLSFLILTVSISKVLAGMASDFGEGSCGLAGFGDNLSTLIFFAGGLSGLVGVSWVSPSPASFCEVDAAVVFFFLAVGLVTLFRF